ncbi:MAG TPA: tetratricopeptide repeat protein [Thermoanaerobaculia bacterium]
MLILALLAAAALADPPVKNVPQPGYVPPVLKGIKGEGTARHSGPIPFPAADEAWQRVTSKHFDFISAAGEKRTREMAEQLETLASALGRLNPRFDVNRGERTRVYVFARKSEVQPYFDMLVSRADAHVNGLFVSQKSNSAIIMLAGSARDDRTPFHELVHWLIESRSQPPLWLEEGLAEVFGHAEMRSGFLYAGAGVQQHIDALRTHDMPLANVFRIERESDAYNVPEGQAVFYAKSWAVVDWLFRNGGNGNAKFYDFFRDVEHGAPIESALQQRYGIALKELERNVGAYGGRLARTVYAVKVPIPEADKTLTSAPLGRAQLLYELGRFFMFFEEMAGESERHFRAALDIDPRHARALASIAVLRANAKLYGDAAALFEKAIAADAKDAQIQLDYAEALMQNEIGPLAESEEVVPEDAPRFRKARALAQAALDLGADPARALADLGTSYLVEDDPAPGIAALEKVHAMLPARTDVALHLFSMLRRSGRPSEELFKQLDAARSPQVRFAARSIIVRQDLARTNELLKAGKYDDAAAILRALAASSPDGDTKADFERKAADVAKAAESNRQIGVYNDAVALVNKGKYAAARKTLTELLATATDPIVIRDAKKLQAELKGRKDLK